MALSSCKCKPAPSLPPLIVNSLKLASRYWGLSVPIPTLPLDRMRSLSLPAVSNVIVSAEGNLIFVLVSPV